MDMSFRAPTTAKGWISIGIIVLVLLSGIWPVIALFDANTLAFGLPLLMVWSIAVLFITTAAMVVINRITGDMGDVDPLDAAADAGEEA
ncbi:hypothetical protein [Brevibacterium jeotgali]|uniref:Uncharacterized protein n=1 Tax=Brevibacterium jeotgali TaxID=1262550 RepID=A0A2H1L529_9MICO|nr:hypothetical protein [Brevibacterium jeotgali]TWB98536.1 hypothetical protein FB108_2426 [Brevibacterium jeotgali]SMY12011.1 hypothetical protein BJEO58_01605 [Brevibacterium jeotgali]